MGIAAILSGAIRQVPWVKVATAAMQYGPDLVRKLKDQVHQRHYPEGEPELTVDELYEEIRELQGAILNQEKVIQEKFAKILVLEQNCQTLQKRLNLYRSLLAVSAVALVVVSLILLAR